MSFSRNAWDSTHNILLACLLMHHTLTRLSICGPALLMDHLRLLMGSACSAKIKPTKKIRLSLEPDQMIYFIYFLTKKWETRAWSFRLSLPHRMGVGTIFWPERNQVFSGPARTQPAHKIFRSNFMYPCSMSVPHILY